jgi:hypothetical protein
VAEVPQLRRQLHHRRHLLEQPSPHDAFGTAGERADPVDQLAPAVLVVAAALTSGWIGENHFAPVPVAGYGVVLFMSAVAYFFLVRAIVAVHGDDSEFAARLGTDWKGKIPLPAYALGSCWRL